MWRAFKKNSLKALLDHILQIRETADGNTSAVSALGKNLQGFAQQVTEKLKEIAEQLTELDTDKCDRPAAVSFTIPASGWASDNTADYPQYYDLAVSGVTAADRADVAVAPAGFRTAADCGLCPSSETLEGKIRLRAVSVPAENISAVYWLEKGKE